MQVQASGFAENLHPPTSDSIFRKKPAHPNTTFLCHQNNNDRPDGKTHNLKIIDMKRKNVINDFKNVSNEKQNSLASGIRIGLGGNFPVLKQQFVKIKEAEYSTDFEFFLQNQVHVVVNNDKSCSICSSIEKRAFQKGVNCDDDTSIYHLIENIHRDIITFKFGGDLVY